MQTLRANEQRQAPNRVPFLSWDEPVSEGLITQNLPVPSGANPGLAELVDPGALFNLGLKYATGEGVQPDLARAIACYRESAENGYARAQVNLGCMYVTGQGTSKDSAEALKWFQKAAAQGMDRAKYNLGLMYLSDESLERNDVVAVKWFREAAEQGLAEAQFDLGCLHEIGEGAKQDLREAAKWYRLAAEQDNAKAQHNLGMLYLRGAGVVRDPAAAARWFRRAAEQGWDKAQNSLGILYASGDGLPEDAIEAARWLRQAAEQGLAAAQLNLGSLYEKEPSLGHGPAESAKLYRWAAEQGIALAQVRLGRFYAVGVGLAKNNFEAYKWITIAVERGGLDDPSLTGIRHSIAKALSSTQLAEIQELVRTWRAKSWKEVSGDDLSAPVFFITKLIETWGLKQTDAASLLGFGTDDQEYVNDLLQGKETLQGQDTEERIAYLFQIRAILRAFFRDEDVEKMWLRKSTPLLDGSKPIDLILDGSKESFRRVRECIDLITRRL